MDLIQVFLFGAAAWGLFEIGRYFVIEYFSREEIEAVSDYVARTHNGMSLRSFAVAHHEGISIFVLGPSLFILVMSLGFTPQIGIGDVAFIATLAAIIIGGNYVRPISLVMIRHIRQKQALGLWQPSEEAIRILGAKPSASSRNGGMSSGAGMHFGDADDDDDFFAYNGNQQPKSPRGFDDRHPDDAKFWAVVDDPNAPDGERRNAFEMILRARARRNAKSDSTERVFKMLGHG